MVQETVKKDVYALFIHELPNGSGYGHILLRFVYLDDKGKPCGFDDYADTFKAQGVALNGLELRTFYSIDDDELHTISHDIEYKNVYISLDLVHVERMASTLRKIDKGVIKLAEQFGYAEDFAALAIRVCRILGVKAIVRESHRYDGQYYTTPVVDLPYAVNGALSDASAKVNKPYLA